MASNEVKLIYNGCGVHELLFPAYSHKQTVCLTCNCVYEGSNGDKRDQSKRLAIRFLTKFSILPTLFGKLHLKKTRNWKTTKCALCETEHSIHIRRKLYKKGINTWNSIKDTHSWKFGVLLLDICLLRWHIRRSWNELNFC